MESDESRGAAQPPPTPAGLRAGCHVHPQPLAQPRAAGGRESRCWEVAWPSLGAWLRNAGGKLEWRKRRETFMNTHTHTADHCLSPTQEETRARRGWHGLAQQPVPRSATFKASKHPPGIPPSSHQSSHQGSAQTFPV